MKKRQPKKAVGDVVTTKAELRRRTGYTAKSIDELTARVACPGGRRGPWRVSKFVAWSLGRGGKPPNVTSKVGRAPRDARAERLAAIVLEEAELRIEANRQKIRKATLANDRAEGKMISTAEVQQAAGELVLRVKARLEQIPDDMETEFPIETRSENRATLERYIDAVLRELADFEIT